MRLVFLCIAYNKEVRLVGKSLVVEFTTQRCENLNIEISKTEKLRPSEQRRMAKTKQYQLNTRR